MEPLDLWNEIFETDGVEAFKSYCAAGGDMNFEHPVSGWTLLHFACEHERLNLISELARSGADLEKVPACGYPAIFVALDIDLDGPIDDERVFDFTVTRHLVSVGARTDSMNDKGRSMWQVLTGYGPIAKEQFADAFGAAPRKHNGEQDAGDQAPAAVE